MGLINKGSIWTGDAMVGTGGGAETYIGDYNALTNTPNLKKTGTIVSTSKLGDFYIVTVTGTQDLGGGSKEYGVGDKAKFNGSFFVKEDVVTPDATQILLNKSNPALGTVAQSLNSKANSNDVYTKSETNNLLNTKENSITAGTVAQYYRGDKTWQTLNATAVGLGNVDNTSDINKPISKATQTALNQEIQDRETADTTLQNNIDKKANLVVNSILNNVLTTDASGQPKDSGYFISETLDATTDNIVTSKALDKGVTTDAVTIKSSEGTTVKAAPLYLNGQDGSQAFISYLSSSTGSISKVYFGAKRPNNPNIDALILDLNAKTGQLFGNNIAITKNLVLCYDNNNFAYYTNQIIVDPLTNDGAIVLQNFTSSTSTTFQNLINTGKISLTPIGLRTPYPSLNNPDQNPLYNNANGFGVGSKVEYNSEIWAYVSENSEGIPTWVINEDVVVASRSFNLVDEYANGTIIIVNNAIGMPNADYSVNPIPANLFTKSFKANYIINDSQPLFDILDANGNLINQLPLEYLSSSENPIKNDDDLLLSNNNLGCTNQGDLNDALIISIGNKIDKVVDATPGSLAGLDSGGNVIDSGIVSGEITTQGNTFNGANELVQLDNEGLIPDSALSALVTTGIATAYNIDISSYASITNFVLGNGTLKASFSRTGLNAQVKLSVTIGSTTQVNNALTFNFAIPNIGLKIAQNDTTNTSPKVFLQGNAQARKLNSSEQDSGGAIYLVNNNQIQVSSDKDNAVWSNSLPFNWAVGDEFDLFFNVKLDPAQVSEYNPNVASTTTLNDLAEAGNNTTFTLNPATGKYRISSTGGGTNVQDQGLKICSVNGSDVTGDGTPQNPYKTANKGLAEVKWNGVVKLEPSSGGLTHNLSQIVLPEDTVNPSVIHWNKTLIGEGDTENANRTELTFDSTSLNFLSLPQTNVRFNLVDLNFNLAANPNKPLIVVGGGGNNFENLSFSNHTQPLTFDFTNYKNTTKFLYLRDLSLSAFAGNLKFQNIPVGISNITVNIQGENSTNLSLDTTLINALNPTATLTIIYDKEILLGQNSSLMTATTLVITNEIKDIYGFIATSGALLTQNYQGLYILSANITGVGSRGDVVYIIKTGTNTSILAGNVRPYLQCPNTLLNLLTGVVHFKDAGYWTAKENSITASTTAQYYRGDKTWQTLNATAVGLVNVTNDAQLKRSAGDFASFSSKATPVANDILLIEDSANANAKGKITLDSVRQFTNTAKQSLQLYYSSDVILNVNQTYDLKMDVVDTVNTKNIPYNATTGVITLTPGIKYRIFAKIDGYANTSAWVTTNFVTSANVILAQAGGNNFTSTESLSSGTPYSIGPVTNFLYTPTGVNGDNLIKLRTIGVSPAVLSPSSTSFVLTANRCGINITEV